MFSFFMKFENYLACIYLFSAVPVENVPKLGAMATVMTARNEIETNEVEESDIEIDVVEGDVDVNENIDELICIVFVIKPEFLVVVH